MVLQIWKCCPFDKLQDSQRYAPFKEDAKRSQQNQFGMVEVKKTLQGHDNFILAHQVEQVYYMLCPCTNLSAWWIVCKVNPNERLHTPPCCWISWYLDGAYCWWGLPKRIVGSFQIEPTLILDFLVSDNDGTTISNERSREPTKKKVSRPPLKNGDILVLILVKTEK